MSCTCEFFFSVMCVLKYHANTHLNDNLYAFQGLSAVKASGEKEFIEIKSWHLSIGDRVWLVV